MEVLADFDLGVMTTADRTSVLSALPNSFSLWRLCTAEQAGGHLAQWSVGFIANTIFVTFRGSANALDVVIDLSFVPTPLTSAPPPSHGGENAHAHAHAHGSGGGRQQAAGPVDTDVMVPCGMLASVMWEEPHVFAAIEDLMAFRGGASGNNAHGFTKMVFSGHSLGGGLATVCALRFAAMNRCVGRYAC